MKTACPKCNQHIEGDEAWAGVKVSCPTCQQEFTMPSATLPRALPIAPVMRAEVPPPPLPVPTAPQQVVKTSHARTIQVALVCLAILIGLWIWKGASPTVTVTNPDGTKVQVNTSAIEEVLRQDSTTQKGVRSVAEIVGRMKAIDTLACPGDFRAAYLAHTYAWGRLAEVEQKAIALKANNESTGAYVEAFVRGLLGDPFGRVRDEHAAQNQLEAQAQDASRQIRDTFQVVQELAVRYGARLPTK